MDDVSKDNILFNLQEALEELTRTVEEMTDDPEYCESEFCVAMQHLYHHINSAWNGRHATIDEIETQDKFVRWRQFPNDMDMSE